MPTATKANRSAPALPKNIGRFQPIAILGRGGQGVVYLAKDPKLGRKVAVKTLLHTGRDPQRLLAEAKNVARLDHAGVVPLYEVDFDRDKPYLVFQYALGEPLSTLIENNQIVPANRAIRIVVEVLDAMSYAHECGILHRDLSPANILINSEDRVRILDFGVSTIIDAGATSAELVGTVNYLPPECLNNEPVGPYSDLFSIAVIFHELLTGKRLFSADNQMAIIYKVLNEPIVAPSRLNRDIDPELDEIVLRGLERDPRARFQNADDMKTALETYLAPSARETAGGARAKSSAIEFMLRRAARKPDFPAVSRFISEINQKTGSRDQGDAGELGDVVLKDYALTSKLLRLVNSPVYGQYGGTIGTVSRAIVIMGFDQVRAAALSIAVFEHLQNGEQADVLKDAACSSFLSAMLSKELGNNDTSIDSEEAFIAGMFHRLGRHLTIYYFPEEYREILTVVTSKGISEPAAAKEVFGASFAEFGAAVGKEWNLPDDLQLAMKPQPDGTVKRANSAAGKTAQIAAFANELSEAVGAAQNDQELEQKLAQLHERYGECVAADTKSLRLSVANAIKATQEYADVLSVDIESSAFFKNVVRRVTGGKPVARDPSATAAGGAEACSTQVSGANETSSAPAALATAQPQGEPPEGRNAYLVNALADITAAILDEVSINEIFTMVTAAFYYGMSFSHVILMIRDPKRHLMQARSGFGTDTEDILKKFNFKTANAQDIFNLAVVKHKEFIVLDVEAEQYKTLIPQWCLDLTAPRSLILFPIIANKNCIGLVYADQTDKPAAIGAQEFKLLKTLINQASLALQQRR